MISKRKYFPGPDSKAPMPIKSFFKKITASLTVEYVYCMHTLNSINNIHASFHNFTTTDFEIALLDPTTRPWYRTICKLPLNN